MKKCDTVRIPSLKVNKVYTLEELENAKDSENFYPSKVFPNQGQVFLAAALAWMKDKVDWFFLTTKAIENE